MVSGGKLPVGSGRGVKRGARSANLPLGPTLDQLPAEQIFHVADYLRLSDILSFTLALGKRGGVAMRSALAEVIELKRAARMRHSTPTQVYARWAALPQPLMGALSGLSQEMLLPVVVGAALTGSAVELSRLETLALRHAVTTTINAGERALRARQSARDSRDQLAMIQRCIEGDTNLAAAWRRVGGDEVFGKLLNETLCDVSLRSKLLGVYGNILEDLDMAYRRRMPLRIDHAARVWLGRASAHPVEVFGATVFCSASMAFSHLILGGVAAREPSGTPALRVGSSCDIARTLERVLHGHPFSIQARPQPVQPQKDGGGPSEPAGGSGSAAGMARVPRRAPARRAGASQGKRPASEASRAAAGTGAASGVGDAGVSGDPGGVTQCDKCAAKGSGMAHCRVCQHTLCAACVPPSNRHRCDPKCDVSSDPSVTEVLALRMMSFATMLQSEADIIQTDERLAVNRALIETAQAQRKWLASVGEGRAEAERALAKSAEAHAQYVRETYNIPDPFQTMGDAPTASSEPAPCALP